MSTLDNMEIENIEPGTKQKPTLMDGYTELIKIDDELNKCPYYSILINNDIEKEEFMRLYNSISLTEGVPVSAKGKFFDVTSYCRLMLKDKSVKLTAAKLENNVFVIAIPVGQKETGEITYHFTEYTISKGDKTNISEKTKGKVKSTLSNEERFNYFQNIVLEYVKDMRKGLSEFNNELLIPVASKIKTWNEFKDDFIDKYRYEPDEFDFNDWIKYDSYRFDARDLDSIGHIIPLTIEYHDKDLSTIIQNHEVLEEDVEDIEQVQDDEKIEYDLGDNKFVNTDVSNKYIIDVEEEKEETKNKFINEYQSKYFKPEEVLDDIEEETLPLSFEESLKEQKKGRRFVKKEPIKKYTLSSNLTFNTIKGTKKIIKSLPLSFNLTKQQHKYSVNKKVDKVYELSSTQEFGTSELARKIKLSQSVPFSKGREKNRM